MTRPGFWRSVSTLHGKSITWLTRRPAPGTKVLESADRGYRFRVYADPGRQGFEIVADESGRIRGRKFVPWSFEPRWGIDAQDMESIERATGELLKAMEP